MDQQPIYLPAQPPDRSQTTARAVALLVLVGLLLLVGFLGYEFFALSSQNSQLKSANTQLQQKITSLNKQLGSTGSVTGTTVNPNSAITPTTCKATSPSQGEEDAIGAAVTAGSYVNIKKYMAAKVVVAITGQDKSGDETPDQAVADLKLLDTAAAPWNFDLSGDTLGTWRAGSFAQYFSVPNYSGESADNQVVSFQFDTCAKVRTIFMTSSAGNLAQ